MSVNLRDKIMQQLMCSSCALPISFGPVTRSLKGYQCGRCSSIPDAEQNSIYETLALASNYLFPCKYKVAGCDILLPFGKPMEKHEGFCPKITYKCPEECNWNGTFDAIEEHYKAVHSAIILQNLKLEVNLGETTKLRYAYFYKDVVFFLIDVSFNKVNGLTVELMRVLQNETMEAAVDAKYIMVLHNRDDTFTFSRNLGKYFLNRNCAKVSNNKFIDITLLNYITTDKIIINFELNLSKIYKQAIYACKNRMYGCNVFNIKNFYEVQQHENTCIVYGCPLGKKVCGWQGVMDCIVKHCQEEHRFIDAVLPIIELDEILSSGESTFFYIAIINHAFGRRLYFRVCIKLETDSSMYIAVQHFGGAYGVTNYNYYVQLNKSRRNLHLPCSAFTIDEEAFDNSIHISLEPFEESILFFNYKFK